MATRFPQIQLIACLLPWKADYTLDEAVFRKHVQTAVAQGYQHLYLMGTAGEGYAVTDRQFEHVVSVFCEEMQGDGLAPMVGVISLSMGQILDRISFAHKMGIHHFQISLPSWGALSDGEMLEFFRRVGGEFPEAKFLHYNLPRARRIITGREYRRIADAVPNLVATKNSTSDYARVADLMTHVPDLQHCFLENAFAFGCLFGECSLLCSLGLLFPKLTHRFFELGRTRKMPELMAMHKEINQILNSLIEPVRETHIDGAYDKMFAWLRDPAFPMRLLPPYHGLSEEETRLARGIFESRFGHLE
ncbi:MAG: dihydrodipicolinate synthase family protein [Acidobacteriota bacterium]|nr:dihydrodipicolinate synthase family protein [Acidobacteriota bacterium]